MQASHTLIPSHSRQRKISGCTFSCAFSSEPRSSRPSPIPLPGTPEEEQGPAEFDGHGHQARGLVRRARRRRRRLRPRRAGGAGPHLPLRLHRSRRRHGRRGPGGARRCYADGDAGRGGARAGAGGRGAGDGRVPRVGRAPEPGGDAGAAGPRAYHGVQVRAVRGGAAVCLLPRLHPSPVPHRRPGYSGARPGRRHRPDAGPGHGGYPDLLAPLRRLRDDPRPADDGPGVRPDAHRPYRRRQYPRRRQLLRRVHEPGTVLRSGAGHWRVDPPLGLLAWPARRRAPRRTGLRDAVLGQENARASARWGLLEKQVSHIFCGICM